RLSIENIFLMPSTGPGRGHQEDVLDGQPGGAGQVDRQVRRADRDRLDRRAWHAPRPGAVADFPAGGDRCGALAWPVADRDLDDLRVLLHFRAGYGVPEILLP